MSRASGGVATTNTVMTDVSMSPVVRRDIEPCTGGSGAAAGWLGLAATPTFAILTLWTSLFVQPDMLCMGKQDSLPLNGMALMYAFMSVFHAAPWLQLISGRKNGARR